MFFGWEYLPGTFHQDKDGFPHGTGVAEYSYDAGPLKLKERYLAGKLIKSIWYRPDGTVIAATKWENASGTGYYLREDGSVKTRMEYVNGVAHGTATYYREDGTIEKEVEYYQGQPVEP